MASRAAIPGIQLPKGSTRFFVENLLPENPVLFHLALHGLFPVPLGLQALSLFGMKGVSPGRQPPVKKTAQPLQGFQGSCGTRSGSIRGLGLLISGGGIIGNAIKAPTLC
jgi:hypothetical protein